MINLFELSAGMASTKVLSERAHREGTYIPPALCLLVAMLLICKDFYFGNLCSVVIYFSAT
jgi:hypothetical protein